MFICDINFLDAYFSNSKLTSLFSRLLAMLAHWHPQRGGGAKWLVIDRDQANETDGCFRHSCHNLPFMSCSEVLWNQTSRQIDSCLLSQPAKYIVHSMNTWITLHHYNKTLVAVSCISTFVKTFHKEWVDVKLQCKLFCFFTDAHIAHQWMKSVHI